MLKGGLQVALLAYLFPVTLWAATDSFVGDWKLNPSKSKLIDKMKVESLGGNKYEFDLGGGPRKSWPMVRISRHFTGRCCP